MKIAILCLLMIAAAFAKDSLTVSPASPTTRDSVTLGLYNDSLCCCTQYLNKILTVHDSVLTMQYVPNATPCMLCNCFGAGSWVSFTSAPLKAGAYNVYRQEIPYCPPGQICTNMVPAPVKMGRFTVKEFTSIEGRAPAAAELFTVSPNPFSSSVTIRPGASFPAGRISLYDIRGDLLGEWQARNRDIIWNAGNRANGLYFLKAEKDGRIVVQRLLLQK